MSGQDREAAVFVAVGAVDQAPGRRQYGSPACRRRATLRHRHLRARGGVRAAASAESASASTGGVSDEGGGWIRRTAPMQGRAMFVDSVEWSVPEMRERPVNLLEEIVWEKTGEVDQKKEKVPFLMLKNRVRELSEGADAQPARGTELLDALRRHTGGGEGAGRIVELRNSDDAQYDPIRQTQAAADDGAVAVAVQTSSRHFHGCMQDMNRASAASTHTAIVCTEVMVLPYQLYDARYHRADAVVLSAAVFPRKDLEYMLAINRVLGMASLVEVNSRAELEYVRSFGTKVQAVLACARDLDTMISRTTAKQLDAIVDAQARDELREANVVVLTETDEANVPALAIIVDGIIVNKHGSADDSAS